MMAKKMKGSSSSSSSASVEMLKKEGSSRASMIKNKILRQAMYRREKLIKLKEKREKRKKLAKEREQLGENAPPKPIPKTLESTREPEETTVLADDPEILQDEKTDEFSGYFDRKTSPKILITSFTRAHLRSNLLMRELADCIPNSDMKWRRGSEIKSIIPEAIERDYTDIIIIEENRKIPSGLWLIHLPEGPTAYFKLTNYKRGREIKGHGTPTSHYPEVILNRFSTKLGHTIGRMFASLFPQDPNFKGRRAVTFHNQRDFIFFRHHRYIFRDSLRVGLQELGPRFTLKLRTLQKGTFDTKFGQYMWMHNRKKMDTSRRRFHL
ncbi:PREDICTED: ribosome production factor 1-like [Amphimedon queenslandica]|uniref:Brix domain-containing protein n=1 Tax=Amphimedon queenslandica TaxID=400682 RepID=A0A1X7U8H2_AMPQE|nr:PREDICTED: ribosome production factor 1-like [Amphimedon queenslandica]|eukprot:XP_003388705.2 PREDICTED: ribosome production factor 1-like [Amphimedon queenslandica]